MKPFFVLLALCLFAVGLFAPQWFADAMFLGGVIWIGILAVVAIRISRSYGRALKGDKKAAESFPFPMLDIPAPMLFAGFTVTLSLAAIPGFLMILMSSGQL